MKNPTYVITAHYNKIKDHFQNAVNSFYLCFSNNDYSYIFALDGRKDPLSAQCIIHVVSVKSLEHFNFGLCLELKRIR